MTIYEPTAQYLFDNVLYAEKMGFNNFFCIPDTRHNFSKEGLVTLEQELQKIFTYFIGSLLLGVVPIRSSIIDRAFIQALGTYEDNTLITRDINRCGLGTTSIAISPLGLIYGCQEQIGQNNKFLLGDLKNGIDQNKHKALLEEYRTLSKITCEYPERCAKCNYKSKCLEVRCPSAAINNFFVQSNTMCFWYETLYNLALGILKSTKSVALYQYLERMMNIELYYLGDGVC